MQVNTESGRHRNSPRHARWPYWVFVPVFAVIYSAYCTWFLLEAWGRQGMPKPAWFDVAFVLATPGMFIIPIPIVGSFVLGGVAGYIFVWFSQWITSSNSLSK